MRGRFGMRASRLGLCAALAVLTAAPGWAAPPDRRVVAAAKRGDIAAVRAAIRAHADVNTPQPDGAAAIHWAAHRGDVVMADALIAAGARVNVVEEGGVTPLALAALNRDDAMVERLLRAGAQPNLGRETAVLSAARSGSVPVTRRLLAAGGDANAKEPLRGQTALMWAAAERHHEIITLLVQHGADVNATTVVRAAPDPTRPPAAASDGDGARADAARSPARGGPGPNGSNGYSALLFATRAGHLESVRALVQAGARINDAGLDGISPLIMATVRGHVALATWLLDHGADARDGQAGYTALHWAAGSWETELTVTSITPDREGEEWTTVAGPREGRMTLVTALLAHGADPNARITRTPARVGSSKNPQLPELQGATPFIVAAVAGHVDVMRALVAHGADPRLTTTQRATALMAAAGMGRVIGEVLVPEAQTLAAATYLFELGDPDVNAVDTLGNSALHYAAFMRRDTIVQLLVDRGARIDGRNSWGETPLFLAEVVFQFAGGGRYELGPTSTGALLRSRGAQPSTPDYALRPLYWPNIPHV